jgi:hypothetical protein
MINGKRPPILALNRATPAPPNFPVLTGGHAQKAGFTSQWLAKEAGVGKF